MVVNKIKEFKEFLCLANQEPIIAWDIETTGLVPYDNRDQIIGMAFYLPKADQSFYLPFRQETCENLPLECYKDLEPMFFNSEQELVTFNGKFDLKFCQLEGLPFKGFNWDVSLLAHSVHNEMKGQDNKLKLLGKIVDPNADAEEVGIKEAAEEWKRKEIEPLEARILSIDKEMTEFERLEKIRMNEGRTDRIAEIKQLLKKENQTKLRVQDVVPLQRELKVLQEEKKRVQSLAPSKIASGLPPHWHDLNTARLALMDEVSQIKKINPKTILAKLPIEVVAEYGEQDVVLTWKLYLHFKKILEARGQWEINRGVCEYSDSIYQMELNGLLVDEEYCEEQIIRCDREQAKWREEAYKIAGFEINLNSPMQLCKAMGLQSSAKDILEECEHPLAKAVLDYRGWGKARDTYFKPILECMTNDGRIHPNIYINGTVSYRASIPKCETSPAMQTLPRDSDTFAVRGAIVSPPGWSLFECDLSQAELRIFAHYTGEPVMIEAFMKEGADFHTETANALGIDRAIAKSANFCVIYGGTGKALYSMLLKNRITHISLRECEGFIETYKKRLPIAWNWIEKTSAFARRNKKVKLWTGRERVYEKIVYRQDSVDKHGRFHSEGDSFDKSNTGVNSLIQGGVAEIIRIGTTNIHRDTKDYGEEIKICLQVHDSLEGEVRDDVIEKWMPQIKGRMENVAKFRVPLIADLKIGKRWGQLKEVKF